MGGTRRGDSVGSELVSSPRCGDDAGNQVSIGQRQRHDKSTAVVLQKQDHRPLTEMARKNSRRGVTARKLPTYFLSTGNLCPTKIVNTAGVTGCRCPTQTALGALPAV